MPNDPILPEYPPHEELIRFWLRFDRLQRRLELLEDKDVNYERPCDGDINKVIRWWLEWMKINEL